MSGVPGKDRTWILKRRPRAWSARRRAVSGPVLIAPMPAIMRDLISGETMSVIERRPFCPWTSD